MKSTILTAIALIFAAAPAAMPAARQLDFVNLPKSHLIIVKIPRGKFSMGTDNVFTRPDGWINDVERPVHQVTISHDFWMGEFVVTQGQWQEVMGDNPSYFKDAGPDYPVEQVDWNQAQTFIARLNTSQSRWRVRLPTEAEWEYAARARTSGERYGNIDEIAWYAGNAARRGGTHPVGKKLPNGFGLYDMLGNVWQWCQDWFTEYPNAPVTDPQGPAWGEFRNTRGGCYYCEANNVRAPRRNRDLVNHSSRSIGFRIVAVSRQ